MRQNYRPGRIGGEIRRIISDMLLRDIKDPALTGLVSITAVDVTRDHSIAKVYLSVFTQAQEEEEKQKAKEEVLAGMERAKGLFRREISRQLDLRRVPELIFTMDESMEYGRHMDELLEKVVKKDGGY